MKFMIKDERLSVSVSKELLKLKNKNIVKRIWNKDYTIWSDSPDEISNRLGWLNSIGFIHNSLVEINSFVKSVIADGFKKVILMGMGGSSLAPEVFRLVFGVKDGFPDLTVVDSTHPDFLIQVENELNYNQTLFLVSTKSGGTVETISFMKYFYNRTIDEIGKENAGNHFAAITDPGSGLEKIANELNFRKIFLNDSNIGGRYSALSFFGMVPAALIGVDLNIVLSRANSLADECREIINNPGVELGVVLGVAARTGINKVTFITSHQIKYFGAWIEQLLAESTGKNGKGIVPIDLEEILSAEDYSQDRIFAYLTLKDDDTNESKINELIEAGFPVVSITLDDIYDLGGEFFRWEFATIVAGCIMHIQPFDQPNVESSKVAAKKMMGEYKTHGHLYTLKPIFVENDIKVFGNVKSNNLHDTFAEFFKNIVNEKSYVAIQVYLKHDEKLYKSLHDLRTVIQKKYKVATTIGYGPRFLHSTGQLHKGDAGKGLFIQIIGDPENELSIPDNPGEKESSISFGVLIKAQALGDREAMLANNRKVLTIDIGNNVMDGLQLILKKVSN